MLPPVRVASVFAAVSNVWFVILWTRFVGTSDAPIDTPSWTSPALWLSLGAGALAASGLYAFGAGLNDVVDARRDRYLSGERAPRTPGGTTSVLACSLALIVSVLGASAFGVWGVRLTLVLALLVIGFNLVGKYLPGLGLVLVALIYAGHMLVPNPHLAFLWPVWLVMTHALGVSIAAHVIEGRLPRLSRRARIAAGAGWVFWSIMIVLLGEHRNTGAIIGWPNELPLTLALWPLGAVALFLLFIRTRLHTQQPRRKVADRVRRYGSLWLTLYATAWALGHAASGGSWTPVWVLGGWSLAAFVGMSMAREAFGLLDTPAGYRR